MIKSFYEKNVLPSILNCCCGTKPITYQRKKIIPRANGNILEIGIGSGLNIPFYDKNKVDSLIAIEPSDGLNMMAKNKATENNIEINLPIVSFDIKCSKGTYIRSVARDLGLKLGCGAHLSKLIRTSQEKFKLSDAYSLDDTSLEKLISLENAFEDLDFIQLNESDAAAFLHGKSIQTDFEHTELLRVYDAKNQFIAIGKKTSKGFKHEYLV